MMCRDKALADLFTHSGGVTDKSSTRLTLGAACNELAAHIEAVGIKDVLLSRIKAMKHAL
jgi:hypothetical protein